MSVNTPERASPASLLPLLSSLLLVGCQSATTPQRLEVKVTRVVSGQTLEVTGIGEATTRVRLVGIDAPDLQQQPWGRAAKERLEAMIENQTVMLEFISIPNRDLEPRPANIVHQSTDRSKDQFGRRLAYVWQDGVLLNEKLVAEGYVLSVPRSPNHKYDQRLSRAQEWARLMGQGIWNPEKPMRLTPAEFRLENR